jgi:hypothetical protein
MSNISGFKFEFVPFVGFGQLLFNQSRLKSIIALENSHFQLHSSLRANSKGSITDVYADDKNIHLTLNYNDDWKLVSIRVLNNLPFELEGIDILNSHMEQVKGLSRARNYFCEDGDASFLFLDTLGVSIKYVDDNFNQANSAILCSREQYELLKLSFQNR